MDPENQTPILDGPETPKKSDTLTNVFKIVLIVILLGSLGSICYQKLYLGSAKSENSNNSTNIPKPPVSQNHTEQSVIIDKSTGYQTVALNSAKTNLSLIPNGWVFQPYWQTKQGFPIILFKTKDEEKYFNDPDPSKREGLLAGGYFSRSRIIRGINLPSSTAAQLNDDIKKDIAQSIYKDSISTNKKVANGMEDCWRFQENDLILVRCYLQLNTGQDIIKIDLNTSQNYYDPDLADFLKIIESIKITRT